VNPEETAQVVDIETTLKAMEGLRRPKEKGGGTGDKTI
jgi:hypothetical protein